ncbi:MAG TPA: nickel pincer cofactor biosynthesis protein LarC, partial [Actinomycetota bacterium]|nr:nickel pincer cofactor biosynthesis protein LarC [Actinomycetota bacterium]
MSTIAYFDCFSGIAGDMTLGALLDAGVPLDVIEQPLSKLPIQGFALDVTRVSKLGISAFQVKVRAEEAAVFRNYFSVRALIEEADVSERARTTALGIYQRLAEAEAQVHGTDVGHVPFHELGSADTIVDVLGTAIGLDYLGVDRVYASAVATGFGLQRSEHGAYPVPGPAVMELLKGAPVYSGAQPYELTTPTGAAILAATVQRWGEMPSLRVARVGYGAGTRELEIPNVVRLIVGEPATEDQLFGPEHAVLLETNIDDMNPELYEFVIERLLGAGAQDAWITPIVMKRGRPAAALSVLCGAGEERGCRDVLFRETTTLGMRRSIIEKWTLPREFVSVDVFGGTVRVKVARTEHDIAGIYPEYSDCARVARDSGRPLKAV